MGEDLRDDVAGDSTPRLILDHDAQPRRTVDSVEVDTPGGVDVGVARDRTPADRPLRLVEGDLGVPLSIATEGSFCPPVRAVPADDTHFFDVVHESREVLEVVPHLIHGADRGGDGDFFFDLWHGLPPLTATGRLRDHVVHRGARRLHGADLLNEVIDVEWL